MKRLRETNPRWLVSSLLLLSIAPLSSCLTGYLEED